MQGLLPVIAPILPHLAEDAWEHVPYRKEEGSVFQAGWSPPSPLWQEGEAIAPTFRSILALRSAFLPWPPLFLRHPISLCLTSFPCVCSFPFVVPPSLPLHLSLLMKRGCVGVRQK